MIAPDVGGGFGPKLIFYPEEAAIAAAALLLLGRPVKWIEDRREHFLTTTQERDQYWDVEMALDADGKLKGVRGSLLHDTGAHVPWGIVMPGYISATTLPGPYVLPAYQLDVTVAYTNKVATTPVRGAGRPQAVFAMERLLDAAARKLKLDPGEIRRAQSHPGLPPAMPYKVGLAYRDGKPVIYDSGDYPAVFEKALQNLARYADFPAPAKRKRGTPAAISASGSAIMSKARGSGPPSKASPCACWKTARSRWPRARRRKGRPTRPCSSRFAPSHLGVALDDIVVTIGDTSAIAMGVGTFASRITANAGPAALQPRARCGRRFSLSPRACSEAKVEDLVLDNGEVMATTGNKPSIRLGDLAKARRSGTPGFSFPQGATPGLENTTYFTPAQAAYCNGSHVVEVEVDIGTGEVKILNYAVAHDPAAR